MRGFSDNEFDLAIVDPPYGIGEANEKRMQSRGKSQKKYKGGDWDLNPPTKEYFNELQRISKNQIIWGANQSIEQVGKFSHVDNVEMSSWSRIEHDLIGSDIDKLIGTGAEVDEKKLNYYRYPEIKKLGAKVRGVYLSNFLPWDPLKQNNGVIKFGFTAEDNYSTFDPYERAGSSIYYGIHDLLKFERQGYRKVTDHLVREIRHNRINEKEAHSLRNHYESQKVNIDTFFHWLGVSKSGIEWYKMHKLLNSKHLITSANENHTKKITLPENIQKLIVNPLSSEEQFIFYGKGVDI
jgi:hypothetical protein